MTTTCGPPGRPSTSVNVRPTCARAPNSGKNSGVTSPANTDSKRSPAARIMSGNLNAATLAKVAGIDRHALNFASDAFAYAPSGAVVRKKTRRDESGYDRDLSRTALTSEKTAVLAPMPMARVKTATTANPGLRRRDRSAYATSWVRAANETPRRSRRIAPEATRWLDSRQDACGVDHSPSAAVRAHGSWLRAHGSWHR